MDRDGTVPNNTREIKPIVFLILENDFFEKHRRDFKININPYIAHRNNEKIMGVPHNNKSTFLQSKLEAFVEENKNHPGPVVVLINVYQHDENHDDIEVSPNGLWNGSKHFKGLKQILNINAGGKYYIACGQWFDTNFTDELKRLQNSNVEVVALSTMGNHIPVIEFFRRLLFTNPND
ncbi:LAC12 [Acrasis kona]|uniref:LAC12 n=1 Tax=Acrasis kona TaxID=1008807 RepID=A0AAW2YGU6_9EUKA